jgi:hypothetical protein
MKTCGVIDPNGDWSFDSLSSRRSDPNFAQVSGYLPKDLVIRFKVVCTKQELSQTDALEAALELWVKQQEEQGK